MVPTVFIAREQVLDPVAAVALGPSARALAERLLEVSDEALRSLTGVAGEDTVAVLGISDALPWVDGIVYLGRDPDAPRLLLPTAVRPNTAIDAFERAIFNRAHVRPPLAILASPHRIFSVAAALPIRRELVRRWLEARP